MTISRLFSRYGEGVAMEAGWSSRGRQGGLDSRCVTEGISFCGLEIKKFDDGAMGSGIAMSSLDRSRRLEGVAEIDQQREAGEYCRRNRCGHQRDRDRVAPSACQLEQVQLNRSSARTCDSYARYVGALDAADNAAGPTRRSLAPREPDSMLISKSS
jgi:hypothetical protein